MKQMFLASTILISLFTSAQGDYERVRSGWARMQKLGFLGQGVKVAIIDAGAIRQGERGVDETWIDFYTGYDFIDDDTTVNSTNAHGNFVLTAVKSSEGLAPDASVYVLRAVDEAGVPNDAAMASALQYCIDNDMDIVNMSFQYSNATFDSLIDVAIASDIVIVASSGAATSESDTEVPAALPGVIAVNNVSALDTAKHYSVNAPASPAGAHGITVAASGVICYVIGNSGIRVTSNGTSFSSPWVAAAFAVYKSRYPTMTNHACMQLLLDRAHKLPNTTYFGAGRPVF